MLLTIHAGHIESERILLPWFPPPTITYFLDHAREIKPRSTLFGVGVPLQCHKTALEASVMFPTSSPWLGFRLTTVGEESLWW